MTDEYESVWDGRATLTDSLDRDYAAMRGDDWELIWEPTSPLTTPWRDFAAWASPDFDQFVPTSLTRRMGPKRRAARRLEEWTRERIMINQQGSHR